MKHIRKRGEPQRLREWRKNNAKFADANYDSHQFPIAAVLSNLIDEQGGICAYTMIRITVGTSHIEHLKPRSVSKRELPPKYNETTDYTNLVACYPKTSHSEAKCGFGADARGDCWDPNLMVTPLMGNCESRFCFAANGEISAAEKSDAAAKWTIDTLVLNHDDLKELRKAAILAYGLSPSSPQPLTAKSARELAISVCKRHKNGLFSPFCVAIREVALAYAAALDRKKQQREFARRSKARNSNRK